MTSVSTFPGFIINATTIAVDYWPRQDNSNITHFFLTHCHADHTKNLDEKWNQAKIFCSKITKKLLVELNKVDPDLIVELEMNTSHIMPLDLDETFNVTLIDANHCPGAVMYLFEGYFGVILATGDFRYTKQMFVDLPLSSKEIEVCYLDNTYFHPIFNDLPSRELATKHIIRLIETKRSPQTLFRLMMRNLGKEELLVELSSYFKTKIVILSEKRYHRYIHVIGLNSSHFTRSFGSSSLIFVDDMSNQGDSEAQNEYRLEMEDFIASKQVITIEPTGLALCQRGRRKAQYDTTIQVPYSDHSSYSEIVEFVKHLRPKKVIGIVRRPLPNQIDTTNLSELNKFLNTTSAPINAIDRYRLLMQSSSSVRRNARLNNYNLIGDTVDVTTAASITVTTTTTTTTRASTPVVNQRFITTRRNTRSASNLKKHIEYESPQKESQLPIILNIRSKSVSPVKEKEKIDDENKETSLLDEFENPTKRKVISVRMLNPNQQTHRLFNVAPPTIVNSSTPIRNIRSAKISLAPITEEESQQQSQNEKNAEKEKANENEMKVDETSKSEDKPEGNVLTPKQLNIPMTISPRKQLQSDSSPLKSEQKRTETTPKQSSVKETSLTSETKSPNKSDKTLKQTNKDEQTASKSSHKQTTDQKSKVEKPLNENARDNRQLYSNVIDTAKELGYETDKGKLVEKTMNWLLDSFYW